MADVIANCVMADVIAHYVMADVIAICGNPECFTGKGKFKDFEYHINVDKKVKLVVHAPQKIALSLQGKLEKELEEMVKQGIIAPVEGHSDWVNSLVIREKPNGSLRICLDPKDLNKAISENTTQYQHWMTSLPDCMDPHYSPSWMPSRATGMSN